MPYISKSRQNDLIDLVPIVNPSSAGELNFMITKLMIQYLKDKGLSYATANEIVGAVECAKREFQRRVVDPYENQKMFDAQASYCDPYEGL